MTTIISNKRDIALNYVAISGRKLVEARGDLAEAIACVKTLSKYVELARQYGCTDKEIAFALGMTDAEFAVTVPQVN